MIFKLSPALAKKADSLIPQHIASGFVESFVTYVLDRAYRKGTVLKRWLREQLRASDEALVLEANKIPTYGDPDRQALAVLKHVHSILTYTSDKDQWGVPEKWSTAADTLASKKGDCEDGAILLYVLARLKGVPADRLYLVAGDVEGGGHAWCAYRPVLYPLNWVFLDWCYWYTKNGIDNRPMFYIEDKAIKGYTSSNTPSSLYTKYKSMWFIVNEEHAHKKLNYKNRNL